MALVAFCLLMGALSLTTGQVQDLNILLCNWGPNSVLLLTISGNDGSLSVTSVSKGLLRPVAVDYDPVEQEIYWTDFFREDIGKMDLRGNNLQTLLQLDYFSSPDGLALDVHERRLFFTEGEYSYIASMDFNGTNITTLLNESSTVGTESSTVGKPRAIIVDPKNRNIFWTDWGTRPHIATANYDGTNTRSIVTSGIAKPNGLALDPHNNYLFWCDSQTHKIESITVDGNDRKELWTDDRADYFDIVYHDRFLYITDRNRRAVLRMTAGGGVRPTSLFSALINIPMGLHVIAESTLTDCSPGTHGMYCHFTCGNCSSGPCNNVTGLCPEGCVPGWQGNDCKTECPPKTYGPCHPCGHCAEGSVCDRMSGYCPDRCRPGWRGLRCDILCQSGTYGKSCTMCGHCDGGVLCDAVSGHCPGRCQKGWTGPLCKTSQASEQSNVVIAAVVGSVVAFLVLLIAVVVVAVVLLRRMKKYHHRSQENDTQSVAGTSSNQPPAYSSQSNIMTGASYTTSSDRATLVTAQQMPDNVMAFSGPEAGALPEKLQRI